MNKVIDYRLHALYSLRSKSRGLSPRTTIDLAKFGFLLYFRLYYNILLYH